MINQLIDYFIKDKNQYFFINDLVIHFKTSEPVLVKELEMISKNYPSIGYYNKTTGWFTRSLTNQSMRNERNNKLMILVLGICTLIFSNIVAHSQPILSLTFIYLGSLMICYSIIKVFDVNNKQFKSYGKVSKSGSKGFWKWPLS